MPEWRVHVHSCDVLAKEVNITNLDLFKMCTILPDLPWEDIGGRRPNYDNKMASHFYRDDIKDPWPIANWVRVLYENPGMFKHSLIVRTYVFHLLLDESYNRKYNYVTTKVSDSQFVFKTYSGVDIIHRSMEDAIQFKFKDTNACASNFDVFDISHISIDKVFINDIKKVYGLSDFCSNDVIDVINADVAKRNNTMNILFTTRQYDDMIKEAIDIFMTLCREFECEVS